MNRLGGLALEKTRQPMKGVVMHPGPISSPGALQGPVARSIPRRRFTVLDAMILTGAIAIGCWAGLQNLVWLLNPDDPEPWLLWTIRARRFFFYLLQPFKRAELGFAVAASWLVEDTAATDLVAVTGDPPIGLESLGQSHEFVGGPKMDAQRIGDLDVSGDHEHGMSFAIHRPRRRIDANRKRWMGA
jgi:hypothetical protein